MIRGNDPIGMAEILKIFSNSLSPATIQTESSTPSSEVLDLKEEEQLLIEWINCLPYDWLRIEASDAEKRYDLKHNKEWNEAVEYRLETGDNSKLKEFFDGKTNYIQEQVKIKSQSQVVEDPTPEELPCIDFRVFQLYRTSYYSNQGQAVNRELMGALEPGYQSALLLWVDGQGDDYFQFVMGLKAPKSGYCSHDPLRLLNDSAYQRLAGKGVRIDPSFFSNQSHIVEKDQGPLHQFLRRWEQPTNLIAVPSYDGESASKPRGILVVEDTQGIEKDQGLKRLLDCSHNIASELRYQSPFVYSQSHTR